MGLFSFIGRAFSSIVEDVIEPLVKVALPIAAQVLPIVAPLIPGVGGLIAQTVVGAGGPLGPPSAAGGAAAVIASRARSGTLPGGTCPPPGILGSGGSPIINAALTSAPDPSRLPARPQFGLSQAIQARIPQEPPLFTNAFNQIQRQGSFSQPGARPFTPSFNTGRGAQTPFPRFAQGPQAAQFPPQPFFPAARSVFSFFGGI